MPSSLQVQVEELSALQRLLYSSNRYALLLIFRAMDAAGKDGAIGHVMSGVNPQGCQVFSFKHPSATELDHDFLWRTTLALPERGRIVCTPSHRRSGARGICGNSPSSHRHRLDRKVAELRRNQRA